MEDPDPVGFLKAKKALKDLNDLQDRVDQSLKLKTESLEEDRKKRDRAHAKFYKSYVAYNGSQKGELQNRIRESYSELNDKDF